MLFPRTPSFPHLFKSGPFLKLQQLHEPFPADIRLDSSPYSPVFHYGLDGAPLPLNVVRRPVVVASTGSVSQSVFHRLPRRLWCTPKLENHLSISSQYLVMLFLFPSYLSPHPPRARDPEDRNSICTSLSGTWPRGKPRCLMARVTDQCLLPQLF